jgi:hypothetical protein
VAKAATLRSSPRRSGQAGQRDARSARGCRTYGALDCARTCSQALPFEAPIEDRGRQAAVQGVRKCV